MTDETNLQGESPAEAATAIPETETPTAESAPAQEQATETPETPTEQKPTPKFRERFSDVYRNWREEQRRNEELMAVLQRLAPPEKPAEPQAPTLEQHGYNEGEYQKALVEYAKAEARREAQETLKREREEAQRQSRVESFRNRETQFADTVEDYYDVVYSPSTPISQAMAEVIAESEHGAQLAYHLGKNPDVARSIYSLPPILAARELGRLEVKLTAPKPPPVSKAPPPPPTIKAEEPAIEKSPAEMTDAEFKKWRARQIAQRR